MISFHATSPRGLRFLFIAIEAAEVVLMQGPPQRLCVVGDPGEITEVVVCFGDEKDVLARCREMGLVLSRVVRVDPKEFMEDN